MKNYIVFINLYMLKKSVIEGDNVEPLLNPLSIPKLKIEDANICEGNLSESELFDALTSMQNNKSPGNDGITKEFYETFWKETKGPFQNSIKKRYIVGELSISQRQAIIKLIEKKEREARDLLKIGPYFIVKCGFENHF